VTWTAHTIHFLTQPELRALFRVSVPRFICPEIACFFLAPVPCWRAMKDALATLVQKLTAAFARPPGSRAAIMALRHQLRSWNALAKRPHFSPARSMLLGPVYPGLGAMDQPPLRSCHAETVDMDAAGRAA